MSKPVASVEDANKVYRPFSRQQEALDFAGDCNAAAVEGNDSPVQGDIVKVTED